MEEEVYDALARRGGDWTSLITNLRRIGEAVGSIPFEPFFEPVSELDSLGANKGQRLTGVTAPLLNAWTRHVGYGTIARLSSLTEPCLRLLLEDQFVVAGLAERCILEHAARAAHALEALRDARRRMSWEGLRELIPKTLFGTCLTDTDDTIFDHLSEPTAQRPIKPGKLIESLESFAGTSETGGQSFFPGLYAFLCDLTHASQRANSTFCRVLEDTGRGWFLQYGRNEQRKDAASMGALRGAMRCLQAGYEASALLLRWRFDEGLPDLVVCAPNEEDLAWIWKYILDPHLVFW